MFINTGVLKNAGPALTYQDLPEQVPLHLSKLPGDAGFSLQVVHHLGCGHCDQGLKWDANRH